MLTIGKAFGPSENQSQLKLEALRIFPLPLERCRIGDFDNVAAGGLGVRRWRRRWGSRGQGPEVGEDLLGVVRAARLFGREEMKLVQLVAQLGVGGLQVCVGGLQVPVGRTSE